MSGIRVSSWREDHVKTLVADRIIVGGKEVRGGDHPQTQEPAEVHGSPQVLVQPQADASSCPALAEAFETAPAGSLLYWNGKEVVPLVVPSDEEEPSKIVVPRLRAGLPPQPVDVHERDNQWSMDVIDEICERLTKLEASVPTRRSARSKK